MDSLELVVDAGRPANAGRFFQLGVDLLALLDELTAMPVAWRLEELRTGSAIARISPPIDELEEGQWLRRTATSLRDVARGQQLPDDWSPDAVKVAHRFIEHGLPAEDLTDDWVPPRLVLISNGPGLPTTVSLTAQLSDQLAELQPIERRMPGSVRGTLVGLNVSRGNRASLRTQSGRVVRVGFETSLRTDLKEALLQQVELYGLLRKDVNDRVFHVRAEEVEILQQPAMRWSDLFGADPQFTGDLTTEGYLEASRSET